LHEKASSTAMPCHHALAEALRAYIDAAGISKIARALNTYPQDPVFAFRSTANLEAAMRRIWLIAAVIGGLGAPALAEERGADQPAIPAVRSTKRVARSIIPCALLHFGPRCRARTEANMNIRGW
jgi:hypothetical protein